MKGSITLNGGHQTPDTPWGWGEPALWGGIPSLRWNTEELHYLTAKKDGLKGSSVGARAQSEILNNKPMQGLQDFFVRTIDSVIWSN